MDHGITVVPITEVHSTHLALAFIIQMLLWVCRMDQSSVSNWTRIQSSVSNWTRIMWAIRSYPISKAETSAFIFLCSLARAQISSWRALPTKAGRLPRKGADVNQNPKLHNYACTNTAGVALIW